MMFMRYICSDFLIKAYFCYEYSFELPRLVEGIALSWQGI